ncbi:O-acyltransferase like protein-like [Haliotis cracherodii]|uniref:O-acyltransferase like protein-like n=1 Tax=Haliotis cracherodii TaxID=6455 RepID=UPI0039ECA3EF
MGAGIYDIVLVAVVIASGAGLKMENGQNHAAISANSSAAQNTSLLDDTGSLGRDSGVVTHPHPDMKTLIPTFPPEVDDPGLFALMGFVNSIEKVKGGGALLESLIVTLDGVNAEQLKGITSLLPLITANPVHKNGGFLKLMSVLASTPDGERLVKQAIGLLGNTTYDEIQDVSSFVPIISGKANFSEGALILNDFIKGNTSEEILLATLGTNTSESIMEVLPAVSELLQTGSVNGMIGELLTLGGTANQMLMGYIGKVGGQNLVNLANTVLPILAPVFSAPGGIFSNASANYTMTVLKGVSHNLQNVTVQKEFGAVAAQQIVSIMNKGIHMLSPFAIYPNIYNLTVGETVLEAVVSLIANLNTTAVREVLGNSSLLDRVADIAAHAQSVDDFEKYIFEYFIQLIQRPRVMRLVGGFLGSQFSSLLQNVYTVLLSFEDDLDVTNLTLSQPLEALETILENINDTKLEHVLGNSSMSDRIMSIVSRLRSPGRGAGVNPQCMTDLLEYFHGLTRLDMWALNMLDASGKPGSSLLKGAVKFYGNYDECLETNVTLKGVTGGPGREIRGSYCNLAFTLPQSVLDATGALDTPMPLPADYVPALEWHLCLPQSCNEDTLYFALSFLPLDVIDSSVYKVQCSHEQDLSHDTPAITAVSVLGLIVFLTLLGTLYDVVTGEVLRVKRKSDNNHDEYDGDVIADFDKKIGRTSFNNGISIVSMNGKLVDGAPDNDSVSTSTLPYEDYDEDQEGVCRRLLLCFSFSRNTEKIFDTSKRVGSLGCVHGIRVLSMAWVILGHMIVYTRGVTDENVTEVLKKVKHFTMQAVVNASLAVDTFFLIGGCLVAFLFLRQAKKTGKLTGRQMAMYYVHRFWRLSPVYLVILMTYTCLFKYMLDGPLKSDGLHYDNVHCTSNWWTNALYINNVYKSGEGCMRWTWFMADDMQFYIIAPLTLVPIVLGLHALGVILMVLLVFVQIATYAYKEYSVDGAMLKNDEQFMREIYFMPWCRVGVFALGLLLGFILNKTKCKVHIPRFALVVGWQVALALGLVCTYITWSEWKVGHISWDRDTRLTHETLSRPAWALFVSWIIFVCTTGHGGIVDRLLSWGAWMPLGRLTYGAYLIHPILITYTDFSKRALVYVDFIFIAYQFIGTFVVSYGVSFVFSVLVEAPTLALETVALGRYRGVR